MNKKLFGRILAAIAFIGGFCLVALHSFAVGGALTAVSIALFIFSHTAPTKK